jgi:hypothetical protein
MVIAQWETETNCGQHKGAHTAQKLSAIKHKRSDPHFNQQQGNQQQQLQASGSGPHLNMQQ